MINTNNSGKSNAISTSDCPLGCLFLCFDFKSLNILSLFSPPSCPICTFRPIQRNFIDRNNDPPGHSSANISIGEALFFHRKKLILCDENYTHMQFNLRVPKTESSPTELSKDPAPCFQKIWVSTLFLSRREIKISRRDGIGIIPSANTEITGYMSRDIGPSHWALGIIKGRFKCVINTL